MNLGGVRTCVDNSIAADVVTVLVEKMVAQRLDPLYDMSNVVGIESGAAVCFLLAGTANVEEDRIDGIRKVLAEIQKYVFDSFMYHISI